MKNKIKELAIYALILSIGYIIGSIHAPFELKWRTGSGLPIVSGIDGSIAFDDSGLEVE